MGTKIGFHITTGSRKGFGDVARFGRGAVSFMADALAEMSPEAFKVFRHNGYTYNGQTVLDIMPGFDQLSPGDMVVQAAYWWPLIYQYISDEERRTGVKFDAVKMTNEVGGNDGERLKSLVAFERVLMPLVASSGYKMTVGNCATNSPDWPLWESIIAPFAIEAAERGHIYSRHCYADEIAGKRPFLFDDSGTPCTSLKRLERELEWFQSKGAHVPVILGEVGFYSMVDPAYFIEQVEKLDNWLAQFDNVGFGALFTYGNWNNANIESASAQLASYLSGNPFEKWNPDADSGFQNSYTVVVVKLPQEFSEQQTQTALSQQYQHRHTFTYSTDDTVRLMTNPLAKVDSYVKVYEPSYPSQVAAVQVFNDAGILWEPVYLDENSPVGTWVTIVDDLPHHPTKRYTKRELDGIDAIVIHHTVSPPDRTIESIARYHVESRGWPGIGYHFVINASGNVFMTNYLDTMSYHAGGHNDHTIGVALQGDFTNLIPPSAQLNAAKKLVAELRQYWNTRFGINLDVQPHRRFSQTSCPGDTFTQWLPYVVTGKEPPINSKPSPEGIDMAVYFSTSDGMPGDIVILKNSWGASDERQQIQADGTAWYVTKNQAWERRIIGDNKIYLTHDTSPGGGQFYVVESETGWMPRYWKVGDVYNRRESVTFYNKSDCKPVGATYAYSSDLKLVWQYDKYAINDIVFNNVVCIQWLVNGNVDETYYFAEGLGLIRWQKYDGKESWASELIKRGAQGDNEREVIPCLKV